MYSLFVVSPIVCVCVCEFCVGSLFCCVALGALSSLAIILPRNRSKEMVA